jgi:hypothetical protein
MAVTKVRGNTQIIDGTIENAQIAAAAGIATTKLADGAEFIQRDGSVVFTGDLDLGGNEFTNAAEPTASDSLATKGYVDSVAQGLAVHEPVEVATTEELAATYDNGTGGVGATLTGAQEVLTIDGVAVALNDRVLVKDQSTGSTEFENGIYYVSQVGVAATTEWILTRATDFDNDPGAEIHDGDFFFVTQGTLYATTSWVQTESDPITVGTDSILFAQFSGAGTYTAGAGILLTGNSFSVRVDDSTIEIAGDDLLNVKAGGIDTTELADDAVTAAKVAADVAGSGLTQAGGGALDVNVDNDTLAITGDAVHINAGGVDTAELADDAVTAAKLAADTAGDGLGQNVGTGALEVNVDDSTIEITTDTLNVKDGGITAAKLGTDSVTAVKLNADVAGLALVQNGGTGALDVAVDDATIEINADALRVKALGIATSHIQDDAVDKTKIASDVAGTGLTQAAGGELDVDFTTLWGKWSIRETPAGSINGANATFTLAATPVVGSEQVFLNGVLQNEGAGNDYTISGATITMASAPLPSPGNPDVLLVTSIAA